VAMEPSTQRKVIIFRIERADWKHASAIARVVGESSGCWVSILDWQTCKKTGRVARMIN
jgi:hypothetical protein